MPVAMDAARELDTSEPINRSYLARFTLGNAALEREVLELFAAQMPLYVEQLRAATGNKEWKLAAHTIKGSAMAVGAQRLASLATSAESLVVDHDPSRYERARQAAAEDVAVAAQEACDHIACLFATA